MRVLTISAQKPDSTGSGVYLAETARGFLESGHEVCVVAGIDRDDEPELPEGAAFRPVRYRTEGLPFPVCGMSDQMPYEATRYRDMTPAMVDAFAGGFSAVVEEALRDFQPDLIVCHHLYLVTAVVTELGPRCPVAAVCHSTDLRQMRSHGLERERIIEGVRRLDVVFALHEEQKREIAELYGVPLGRIVVVGTGYNARLFHPDAARCEPRGAEEGGGLFPETGTGDGATSAGTNPEVLGAGQGGVALEGGEAGLVRIVYAGKIWRKKGVDCLLRCLDQLAFAPDDIVVDLAGGHNSDEEYAAMVALAEEAPCEVNFLGKLPQEALADAYRAADVFVLPSFFEGLPLVLVEALACGCVAVTTDLPGVRPWLSQALPEAPVIYVEPPRIVNTDEPVAADLPAFEARLARALEEAVALAAARRGTPTECRHLSWTALARTMVEQARIQGGAQPA